MNATVTPIRSLRSKQTSVRRIQPNPDGGRPTDLRVLGFEAAFEAIVVESDDLKAFESGWRLVRHIGSVQSMIERRSRATSSISSQDDQRLRQCSDAMSRLVDHMQERCERLRTACIPEAKRIAQVFDQDLQSHGCAP